MPQVLWSLYLNLPASDLKLNDSAPSNIHLCSGPDLDLDFDFAVNQVRLKLIDSIDINFYLKTKNLLECSTYINFLESKFKQFNYFPGKRNFQGYVS